MSQTIKLRPVQLEQIAKIQNQKQQVVKLSQELNEKEGDLLRLIFEEHSITGEVNNVKLEEGTLIFDIKEQAVPKKKKDKEVKTE
jgi:hypothetical protein